MNKTLHEKMRHNADTNRQVKEIDHKMKRANRNLKVYFLWYERNVHRNVYLQDHHIDIKN